MSRDNAVSFRPTEMSQVSHRAAYTLSSLWLLAIPIAQCAAANPSPRDQLRVIVQEQCLPHWLVDHAPEPCERLGEGYGVLHDRKGAAHFLLIPTATVRGIEDPMLLAPEAPNYFAAAWRNRDVLATNTGLALDRADIGMAINHVRARSQDQYHIHLSCIGADARDALRTNADRIGTDWTPLAINGNSYVAMRVDGDGLEGIDPVLKLANHLDGAKQAMGDYTLLVAGMRFGEGAGFILVTGTAVPGAERLLDATCAVARQ